MTWITNAAWFEMRRANRIGLCTKLQTAGINDASDWRCCADEAQEIVVVGNRYEPRCAEHAQEFPMGRHRSIWLSRMAATLNGETPPA